MYIYTAARYTRQQEIARYARTLEELGHYVTSRWLTQDERGMDEADIARRDVQDVRAARTLIYFAEAPRTPTRGGRIFELGLAFGLGHILYVVGEPAEHVFTSHPDMAHYPTFDALVEDWTSS